MTDIKTRSILALSIMLSLFACKTSDINTKKNVGPKNVILLISDGTGLSQISSAFYFKESSPNYSRFNNIGLIKTSSSQQDVTDSAAGATAFACGVKTYNGAIGVLEGSKSVRNLVEIASLKNIRTGIIATSSITHATPASFYAHIDSRGMEDQIAQHLTQSEVDFFAGGGLRYFQNRRDGQNLLKTLEDKKFTIDTTSLKNSSEIKSQEKIGFLLAENALSRMEDGRGNFLSEAIGLGVEFLNKDNSGFFMMAEGSQIDWGGHENNASYLISELIDFDDAIGKALDYAEKNGNTLVIVTSDHETGGFTLAGKKKKAQDGSEYNDYSEIEATFSTGGHSAALIPVFAFGPGSEEFTGVFENTDIFEKILEVTQWRDL